MAETSPGDHGDSASSLQLKEDHFRSELVEENIASHPLAEIAQVINGE